MKKILSFVLICTMLASLLAIGVSAKQEPYGTIVEVGYTTEAPSMAGAMPDASWGEKLAHITKNTPNAGITDYSNVHDKSGVLVNKDTWMDVYAKWTDETLYLCFTSNEKDPNGDSVPYRGDGYQLNILYGISDMSHMNKEFCASRDDRYPYEDTYSYCLFFAVDDYSTDLYGASYYSRECVLYWDEREQVMIGKFALDFTQLGLSKNDSPKENDYISFTVIRSCAEEGDGTHYTGWLEWGDFFNPEKGFDPNDTLFYVPAAANANTTETNTFKLVGKNSGATTPAKEEPKQETPATTTETPSSWAAEEVNASIALGLVPAELQKSYTTGITRGQLALMLSSLLTKAGITLPTSGNATFTDTTDANVLAAANLGIINGYKQADGTYMFKPNNTLKRSEMSAIINRVAKLCGKTTTGYESEVTFTDTASHWCNSELGYPVHMGIVKGTSATTFSPENTLTIEQTIMMVYRTLNALAK